MQLCNMIYYSAVHWRLNMFRAAYRSSSGALTVFAASGLHTHVVTGRSQVWEGTQMRSPHAYVNQRLQIQLELLMMSGMALETCWAFNERWDNKFYYKVAFCWLFLLSHTTMHGSIDIKLPACVAIQINPVDTLWSYHILLTNLHHPVYTRSHISYFSYPLRWYAVAQLVEALRYKPEGCGFDSRWCHWNFSLT